MAQLQWLNHVKRRGGPGLVMASFRIEAAFIRALREFAAQESQAQGKHLSQNIVLMTLALHGSKQFRSLYKRYKASEEQK